MFSGLSATLRRVSVTALSVVALLPAVAAPAHAVSADSAADLQTFRAEALGAHNTYRMRHGVPRLALSDRLNAYAQEWADKLAAKDEFKHRPDGLYGENLYYAWNSSSSFSVSGDAPVKSWYDGVKDYNGIYDRDPTDQEFPKVGCFTQVVWKSTRLMGIGYAVSAGHRHYIVADYDPTGNMMGEFAANVPRPK
ncbi:hypothetical protein P3T39_001673 [Kitasatospora sp. GP82]|nr:hypothetical protein [Kitasatospora sp. GP82]